MSIDTRSPQTALGRPIRRRSPAIVVAAASTAVMAVIYLLIGARIVDVIDPADDQPMFGFVAAGFFAALTVAVALIRRPVVWLSALAIHLFVMFVYFDLAPERVPHYETWGLALRSLQLPAIAALGWLAVARRDRRKRSSGARS
jgi:hypothetical protein